MNVVLRGAGAIRQRIIGSNLVKVVRCQPCGAFSGLAPACSSFRVYFALAPPMPVDGTRTRLRTAPALSYHRLNAHAIYHSDVLVLLSIFRLDASRHLLFSASAAAITGAFSRSG